MMSVVLLGLALSFNACKDDDDESINREQIIGTWETVSVTDGNETYPYDPGVMRLTFQADGKGTVIEEDGETDSFTWTLNGDILTINADSYKIEKLTSTEVVLVAGSTKIICRKIS